MHAPNLLTRALLVTCLVTPLSAMAGPKQDAQTHIAKAMEAHGKNDFSTALTELEAAYALDPIPDLLYAIGQVYVKLERCSDAITYYERYLATKPAAQATADTKQAIETCKAQPPPAPPPSGSESQAGSGSPTATEAAASTTSSSSSSSSSSPFSSSSSLPADPPPASAPVDSAGPRPWYKDKLGGALVLSGVAASAVGLVLYSGARGDVSDAEAAGTLAEYEELVDSAKSKRMFAVVLGAGGAALIGAGVVRYVLLRGERTEETPGVSVVPTRGGGLVTWGGHF